MEREKNPSWKGGRTVTQHGYVLIKVGTEHHLADVRGYAYEHRLNAEQVLGRRLEKGELVHHIDGNRQNNDPTNLEVVSSNCDHYIYHRKKRRYPLKTPSEKNIEIQCGCGCGSSLMKYDNQNRPRRFISGHNKGTGGKYV